jgi:hypothetical protein
MAVFASQTNLQKQQCRLVIVTLPIISIPVVMRVVPYLLRCSLLLIIVFSASLVCAWRDLPATLSDCLTFRVE